MVETGLGEEVLDGGRLLVVAAATPHHAPRCVQPRRVGVVVVVGGGRAAYGFGEREGLGVEVDVVPPGEGAAPVEDDRLDRRC